MIEKKYNKEKDYYWFLGISENAGAEDIRRAFRLLSKKYHPDINPEASQVYMDILEAREILLDKEQRRLYNSERSKASMQKSRREFDVRKRKSDKAAKDREEKRRFEQERENLKKTASSGSSNYGAQNKTSEEKNGRSEERSHGNAKSSYGGFGSGFSGSKASYGTKDGARASQSGSAFGNAGGNRDKGTSQDSQTSGNYGRNERSGYTAWGNESNSKSKNTSSFYNDNFEQNNRNSRDKKGDFSSEERKRQNGSSKTSGGARSNTHSDDTSWKTSGNASGGGARNRSASGDFRKNGRFDYEAWAKDREERRSKARAAYEAGRRGETQSGSETNASNGNGDTKSEGQNTENANVRGNFKAKEESGTFSAKDSRFADEGMEGGDGKKEKHSADNGFDGRKDSETESDRGSSGSERDHSSDNAENFDNFHGGSFKENFGRQGSSSHDYGAYGTNGAWGDSTSGGRTDQKSQDTFGSGNAQGQSASGRQPGGSRWSKPRTGFCSDGSFSNRPEGEKGTKRDTSWSSGKNPGENHTNGQSRGSGHKKTRFDYDAWEKERNSRRASGGGSPYGSSDFKTSGANETGPGAKRSEGARTNTGSDTNKSENNRSEVRGRDIEVTFTVTIDDLLSTPITRRINLPSGAGRPFVDVNLPCGVRGGTRLKVPGVGGKGRFGGKNGDLYVTLDLPVSPFYRVEGDNIVIYQDITPWDAALGCVCLNISVPGLDLPRYMTPSVLAFPGTQTGTRQVNHGKGKGLPRRDGTLGDIIIEFRVVTPNIMTDAEKKLWRMMRDLHPDKNRTSIEAFNEEFKHTSAKYRKN